MQFFNTFAICQIQQLPVSIGLPGSHLLPRLFSFLVLFQRIFIKNQSKKGKYGSPKKPFSFIHISIHWLKLTKHYKINFTVKNYRDRKNLCKKISNYSKYLQNIMVIPCKGSGSLGHVLYEKEETHTNTHK